MITIDNINKTYGSLNVLNDVNLQIPDREIVTIVGPSGAGKTTLLQIIGTLAMPDSGTVKYNDVVVTSKSDKALSHFRNSHIGFVFQFHQLLPEFTALENVAIPAMIGGESRSNAYERANDLLTKLGLASRIDHRPAELSGGEKQRVAIARALVNNPDVILADEPTGSLDSANREEIKQLFRILRNKFAQTIVIVTHDESLTEIADRIITMEDGKITNVVCKKDNNGF